MKSICYYPDWTRETGLQLRPNEINSNRKSRMQTRNKWISDGLTSSPCWAAAAGGGGRGRRHQGRTEAAHRDKWPGEGWLIYREKLNLRWSKINYSYVIYPTSESSMWIVKRSHFDEIFTSAVSDRPSEQRFKKSNFRSTLEPLSFFWRYSGPRRWLVDELEIFSYPVEHNKWIHMWYQVKYRFSNLAK
jgi:hypothetical protein